MNEMQNLDLQVRMGTSNRATSVSQETARLLDGPGILNYI